MNPVVYGTDPLTGELVPFCREHEVVLIVGRLGLYCVYGHILEAPEPEHEEEVRNDKPY